MAKVKLTEELVRKIAYLSRIKIDDDKISYFQDQLDTILEYVDILDTVDLKSVKKAKISQEIRYCDLRDDVVIPGLTQKEALFNAPYQEDGYFKIFGALSEPEE